MHSKRETQLHTRTKRFCSHRLLDSIAATAYVRASEASGEGNGGSAACGVRFGSRLLSNGWPEPARGVRYGSRLPSNGWHDTYAYGECDACTLHPSVIYMQYFISTGNKYIIMSPIGNLVRNETACKRK